MKLKYVSLLPSTKNLKITNKTRKSWPTETRNGKADPQRQYDQLAISRHLIEQILRHNWSVIKQNDKSQIGGNKKTKHAKFSKNSNISYSLMRTRGYKKCSFFRKIWRALFPCYLRFKIHLFTFLPTNYSFVILFAEIY